MEGAQNVAAVSVSPPGKRTAAGSASMKVWDPFVRAFHWLLAAGIAVNYFELVRPGRYPHRVIGYVVLGLVAARLIWGIAGPHHARLRSFVAAPRHVVAHLKAIAAHRDRRFLGHNPAGGAMVVALLAVVLLTGVTGWLCRTDWFFGVKWMEEAHEVFANGLIALICLHVLGVVHGCWRHQENLVLSMVTGRKRAPDQSDARSDAPTDR